MHQDGRRRGLRLRAGAVAAVLAAGVVTAAASASPALQSAPLSPTETAAKTVADTTPDPDTGWLPVDWVRHPQNPVYRFDEGGQVVDRVMPTVMRVDDKLTSPLDGDAYYLWVWRHGEYPRTADNGGRLILLSAPSLEGPWHDHGFVTPADTGLTGYMDYSLTGGDVVWSSRYRKFFTTPHSVSLACTTGPALCKMDSFLMESADGVHWSFSAVTQPVLPAGPDAYDDFETGYGRLLRVPVADGSEHWIWLYRSGRAGCTTCPSNNEYYTLSVAYADDIYGPWTKDPANPVFDPYAGSNTAPPKPGGLFGLTAFLRYDGYYEIIWQDGFLGHTFLSRSRDLHTWEDFAPVGANGRRPDGAHRQVPFFQGVTPFDVGVVTGSFVWDDRADAWAYVYLGYDPGQLAALQRGTPTGSVNVELARSVSGGTPPTEEGNS